MTVDQNVGNLGVGEERFERPEAEDFVEHVDDQRVALEQAQRRILALPIEEIADEISDLGLSIRASLEPGARDSNDRAVPRECAP